MDYPMMVIHCCGPQLSGKSFLLEAIGVFEHPQILFNLFQFYRDRGVLSEAGVMDWESYRDLDDVAIERVDEFLRLNGDCSVVFLVSSGMNRKLNSFLLDKANEAPFFYQPIYFLSPSLWELERRARKAERDLDVVVAYNNWWSQQLRDFFPRETLPPGSWDDEEEEDLG